MSAESVSNLAQLVQRNAQQRRDAEAIVQPDPERRSLSWIELEVQVDAVAAGFADLGVVAGQRVGLAGANSIEYVIGYLAALRAGLVAVPIAAGLAAADVGALLHDCGVKLLLGGPDHPLTPDGLGELARHGHSPVVSPPDAQALAVLLRTAGTSGESRLVMLSHRALLAQPTHAQFPGVVDADTTVLGALPFGHVFGLGAVLGGWLGVGARLVVADLHSDELLSIIGSERVDHLPLTPALLFRLLRDSSSGADSAEPLRSVRRVLSAGAALPERLAREFADRTGLRVEQGYGLTEAPGVSATFGGPVLGSNHVGRPLPGVEVRIGDGSDPGEPELIALRGDGLFSGYWPDGGGGPDADGWFVTDDVGYLRGPELFLVDRARELIVVSGFPVYPTELEQVIRELPRVTGVAAVGIPDPRTGERIVAFVSGRELSGSAVVDHCRSRLPGYKRPAEIRLVSELPRGVTGEIQRIGLRRMLQDERQSRLAAAGR